MLARAPLLSPREIPLPGLLVEISDQCDRLRSMLATHSASSVPDATRRATDAALSVGDALRRLEFALLQAGPVS